MSDAQFWSERVRRYGHTGWSDAAVYAYDQRLRLAALASLLDTSPATSDAAALDFGCGVGDFCTLLATRHAEVVGYDLSAQALAVAARRNAGAAIRYTADIEVALARRYALILGVTVLQHVVDDGELRALIKRFAAALAPGGRVIVLETFARTPVQANDYLKRRSADMLIAAFATAGLVLQRRRGFYHPSECPTPRFAAYRTRPLVRVLARLADARIPLACAALDRLAARATLDDHDYLDRTGSPTEWLVFGNAAA